jgi:hypothetical protein
VYQSRRIGYVNLTLAIEAKYLVALVYLEGEVCNRSDHAFLIVQWTADRSFLFANVHWLCHLEL